MTKVKHFFTLICGCIIPRLLLKLAKVKHTNAMELVRFGRFGDRTIGRLKVGESFFWSVERPWKDNEPFVSCIPDGEYRLIRRDSPRFGPNVWEVADVPNRTHILIHVGNTSNDVVGCIALGKSLFSELSGVGNSRKAMAEFHANTQGLEESTLTITSGYLE